MLENLRSSINADLKQLFKPPYSILTSINTEKGISMEEKVDLATALVNLAESKVPLFNILPKHSLHD